MTSSATPARKRESMPRRTLLIAALIAALLAGLLGGRIHPTEPPRPVTTILPLPAIWIADSPSASLATGAPGPGDSRPVQRWHHRDDPALRLARSTTPQLPEQVLAALHQRLLERDGSLVPDPVYRADGWILQTLPPPPVEDWPQQALVVGWIGMETGTVVWALSAGSPAAVQDRIADLLPAP
jgi:hypothetical protein